MYPRISCFLRERERESKYTSISGNVSKSFYVIQVDHEKSPKTKVLKEKDRKFRRIINVRFDRTFWEVSVHALLLLHCIFVSPWRALVCR